MASQKLITLDLLKQFNHGLCDNMGLTKYDYTYTYQTYTGSKTDKPNKIKLALDDLYDKIEEQAKKLAFTIQVVSTGTNGVQVQFRDKQAQSQELDSFFIAPTTDNIELRSNQENIGNGYNKILEISLNTVSSTSGTVAGDPLTTVAYVNEALQALKDGMTYSIESGFKTGAYTDVQFSSDGQSNENLYAINIKNDDGSVKYNLVLDVTNFLKDSFVSNVTLNKSNPNDPRLVFTFNTESGKSPISVSLADLLVNYTSGPGIDVTGGTISVALNPIQDKYVKILSSEDGIKAQTDVVLTYNVNPTTGVFSADDKLVTASTVANMLNTVSSEMQDDIRNIKHTTVDESETTAITVVPTTTSNQTNYQITYSTATVAEVNAIFAD